MSPLSPAAIVTLALAGFTAIFVGLYRLLTRKQRRTMREIRESARARGWRYRLRRWQGSPTAFRIDGQMSGGSPWVLTAGASGDSVKDWSAQLSLRVPSLAGQVDFAMYPRGATGENPLLIAASLADSVPEGLAAISGTAASVMQFFHEAKGVPSGVSAFDAAYQVLLLPEGADSMVVNPLLARQILDWPTEQATLHSIVAWRDPFGLHLQARVKGPPGWAAIAYFLDIADRLSSRLPPAAPAPPPSGWADKLAGRLMG